MSSSRDQPSAGHEASAPSAAHTPGPWSYSKTPTYGYAADCSAWQVSGPDGDGDGFVVAAIITDVSELAEAGEANARLIAAAPDLLEAAREGLICAEADLEELLQLCAAEGDDPEEDPIVKVFRRRRDKIAAAIAAATGNPASQSGPLAEGDKSREEQ